MDLNFEFTAPTRVIFGCGAIAKIPQLIGGKGKRILLVTGKSSARATPITDKLTLVECKVSHYTIEGEPTIETVEKGVDIARDGECQLIVGIGGGSVIDASKAIAALAPNQGKLSDYLEVIGAGKELEADPLPFMAIPTTAGTGAEVTKNAVIHSPEHRVKVSLRSPLMFPDVAIVDPELTITMPPEITATTGMDALSHLLETFVCNHPNPMTDAWCRVGLRRIATSLRLAYDNGSDIQARTDMSLASMLGGMALANVKLGAVHGFAGPMGGMFPVPHGSACAALLPAVMEINIREVKRENLSDSLARYDELGHILTGNPDAKAEDGIRWIREMVKYLKIPALSTYGLTSSAFTTLSEKAKNASSMKGNPVVLKDSDLFEILEKTI
jgi:alcohol dehydrogenase class IV